MKQFIVFALLAVVATATNTDTDSSTCTPSYPPSCCASKFGCTASELAPYCPACVSTCAPILGCPCTFPGTNEVINPRPAPPAVPRAPFCPQCPKYLCPRVLIQCINPSTNICTAQQIQAWIN